jgi:hypothetical protein
MISFIESARAGAEPGVTVDKAAGAPYVPGVPGTRFVIVNDQLYIAADVVDELEDAIRALTEWLQHPSVSMDPSTIRSITEFQQARLDRALQAVDRQRQKGSEELEEKRMDEDAGNEGEQEA